MTKALLKVRTFTNVVMVLSILFAYQVIGLEFQNVEWVMSSIYGESHSATCGTRGLLPATNFDFSWDEAIMDRVVLDILHYNWTRSVPVVRIKGCCAPSLWCSLDNTTNQTSCFTQAYSAYGDPALNSSFFTYSNIGWLISAPHVQPIYTCYNDSALNITNVHINVSSLALDTISGSITAFGSNFQSTTSASSDIYVSINEYSCRSVELFESRTCTASIQCPVDMACYRNIGSVGNGLCVPQCAGAGDMACPTNATCTNIYTIEKEESSLCIPSTTSYTTIDTGKTELTCKAPGVIYGNQPHSVTVSVATNDNGFTGNISVTSSSVKCSMNSDCFDGSACTEDFCNFSTGYCMYNASTLCESVLPRISDALVPYGYVSYRKKSLSAMNALYNLIVKNGVNITSVDKLFSKSTTLDLPFYVDYFGNYVNQAQINQYGAIALTPFPWCSTIQVVLTSDRYCITNLFILNCNSVITAHLLM